MSRCDCYSSATNSSTVMPAIRMRARSVRGAKLAMLGHGKTDRNPCFEEDYVAPALPIHSRRARRLVLPPLQTRPEALPLNRDLYFANCNGQRHPIGLASFQTILNCFANIFQRFGFRFSLRHTAGD